MTDGSDGDGNGNNMIVNKEELHESTTMNNKKESRIIEYHI